MLRCVSRLPRCCVHVSLRVEECIEWWSQLILFRWRRWVLDPWRLSSINLDQDVSERVPRCEHCASKFSTDQSMNATDRSLGYTYTQQTLVAPWEDNSSGGRVGRGRNQDIPLTMTYQIVKKLYWPDVSSHLLVDIPRLWLWGLLSVNMGLPMASYTAPLFSLIIVI